MSISRMLDDYRPFLSPDEVRRFIVEDRRSGETGSDTISLLLLFATSKQQTWLAASPAGLHCVLDDRRRPKAQYRLRRTPEELTNDGKLTQSLRAADWKPRTGLLYIEPGPKGWLYSKKLFPNGDVVAAAQRLIIDGLAAGGIVAAAE